MTTRACQVTTDLEGSLSPVLFPGIEAHCSGLSTHMFPLVAHKCRLLAQFRHAYGKLLVRFAQGFWHLGSAR